MQEAVYAFAIVGSAFVIGLVLGVVTFLIFKWSFGRDDLFTPIGDSTPPPERRSPFAPPQDRGDA